MLAPSARDGGEASRTRWTSRAEHLCARVCLGLDTLVKLPSSAASLVDMRAIPIPPAAYRYRGYQVVAGAPYTFLRAAQVCVRVATFRRCQNGSGDRYGMGGLGRTRMKAMRRVGGGGPAWAAAHVSRNRVGSWPREGGVSEVHQWHLGGPCGHACPRPYPASYRPFDRFSTPALRYAISPSDLSSALRALAPITPSASFPRQAMVEFKLPTWYTYVALVLAPLHCIERLPRTGRLWRKWCLSASPGELLALYARHFVFDASPTPQLCHSRHVQRCLQLGCWRS